MSNFAAIGSTLMGEKITAIADPVRMGEGGWEFGGIGAYLGNLR